jgi:phage shock protein PspC (stress-responsive transcriptional regulator)
MRDDTFLGVCEAIGEDLGFNAQYLRVALALLVFWSPKLVIGAYLGAAVVVLLSRLIFPNPRVAAAAAAAEMAGASRADPEEPVSAREREAELLAEAA